MSTEAIARFTCFGGGCEVRVAGGEGPRAADRARRQLLDWHDRFSRFVASSELSRLNADPRAAVPASPTMLALAEAVAGAGKRSGGLVDGTLGVEIATAGYPAPRAPGAGLPLPLALRLAPPRRPAGPSPHARWRTIEADRAAGLVRRPPGTAIDGGGLAKGLFADLLAAELAGHPGFVVNCAGDLRAGGAQPRPVHVASPFGAQILHTFSLSDGAAATSGISARSWIDASGAPAHHLLDPATGLPAFTGVVQATALAPTALEAELRAKAALLSGPGGACGWLLPHGGVVVHDDTSHVVIAGTATARRSEARRAAPAARLPSPLPAEAAT
jgi:thiamine biosynthesis lipoprotein